MKITKIGIILSIIFIARLVASCCSCGELTEFFYLYKEVSIQNLDNSGEKAVIGSSEAIPKEAFGLSATISLQRVTDHLTPREISFAKANATSCICLEETFVPSKKIVSIKIFSVNPFQSDIPANSDVSSRFVVDTSDEFTSIENYLKQLNNRYDYYLPDKVNFDLLLLQTPPQTGEFSFRIEITFSDDSVLESYSPLVRLI